MSAENDPETWKWLLTLPALMIGWLHMGNRRNDKSIEEINKALGNTMTRPEVISTVDGALTKFEKITNSLGGELSEIKEDLKYLVRREIEKGDKK